jgi:hypothetical protein
VVVVTGGATGAVEVEVEVEDVDEVVVTAPPASVVALTTSE